VDHSENQIFEIERELRKQFPKLKLIPIIADIRDPGRVHSIVARHRPHAIFHAAAHKHVPLMEENIVEAVTNNVLGTRNVVDAALDADVKHVVNISTDKAVRPTSIMGATKRVAEMIVLNAAMADQRNFVSVRFGNVLGSSGSVIPTFLRQIKEGGPVTVTHPEMRRYFMTIPEAVQLVMQAGALGNGGELFVLEMGEPVKIAELAHDLIRLSGLEEGVDIEIVYTGVRPGEKLYEEVFFGGEDVRPTHHPKVLRACGDTADPRLLAYVESLIRSAIAYTSDDRDLRDQLRNVVPEFAREDARTDPKTKPEAGSRKPEAGWSGAAGECGAGEGRESELASHRTTMEDGRWKMEDGRWKPAPHCFALRGADSVLLNRQEPASLRHDAQGAPRRDPPVAPRPAAEAGGRGLG
jgi:FlaA1/EpsC-like NDP-sugar epimerase